MRQRYVSPLPFPGEKHPAPLRPTIAKDGDYAFYREPMSTEVLVIEPDGESYYMEWFEFETFLKLILIKDDVRRDRLLDRTWCFHRTQWNANDPDRVIVLREALASEANYS